MFMFVHFESIRTVLILYNPSDILPEELTGAWTRPPSKPNCPAGAGAGADKLSKTPYFVPTDPAFGTDVATD